jgi:hypothetical protein
VAAAIGVPAVTCSYLSSGLNEPLRQSKTSSSVFASGSLIFSPLLDSIEFTNFSIKNTFSQHFKICSNPPPPPTSYPHYPFFVSLRKKIGLYLKNTFGFKTLARLGTSLTSFLICASKLFSEAVYVKTRVKQLLNCFLKQFVLKPESNSF